MELQRRSVTTYYSINLELRTCFSKPLYLFRQTPMRSVTSQLWRLFVEAVPQIEAPAQIN